MLFSLVVPVTAILASLNMFYDNNDDDDDDDLISAMFHCCSPCCWTVLCGQESS